MCASILKALDISEFPVKGSICGQGHWERVAIFDKSHHCQKVTLIIEDMGSFDSFATWGKIWKACVKEGISLRNVSGSRYSNERTFMLVTKKTTPLNELIGKISDLESVKYTVCKSQAKEYPIFCHYSLHDKSTGILFGGHGNNCFTLRMKGIVITTVTPIYAALSILFNVAIIIPRIVYLTARIFYDYAKRADDTTALRNIAKDRVKEMGWGTWKSIRNVIRTPFYAIGFMLGTLYMTIDPLNGMKWAGCFEYDWNHRIPVTRSFWFFPQRDFFKEGSRTFCLAGCLAPRSKVNGDRKVVSLNDKSVKEHLQVKGPWVASWLSIPFCCNFSFPAASPAA